MRRHPPTLSLPRSGPVVFVTVLALMGACDTAPATTPAASGGTSSSTPAATTSPVLPTRSPTPTTTPPPSPLQVAVTDTWVSAGETIHAWFGSELVALPDDRAVLFGTPQGEDGSTDAILATEHWNRHTGWQEGGSTDGRAAYVAIGLLDGRVLVAGGQTPERTSLATASIYDPATATWIEVAPMVQARTHAAAALLADGRVLVVGGFAWDRGWDSGRAGGVDLARAPGGTTAPGQGGGVALPDIAVPPFGPALATAEVFDPATGRWSETGHMRFARTGPAIATLADGRVLVAGADGEPTHIDRRAFGTAEVYDPATGTFTSAGTLPGIDRELLASRGVDLPDGAPEPGSVGTLVALPDGGAALVGREVSWKHAGEVVWSARVSPDLATWQALGEPFGQRDFHDATGEGRQTSGVSRLGAVVVRLLDGSVLIAGGSPGYSIGGPAAGPLRVERYDGLSDAWSSETDLPEPRENAFGVVLTGGTVLVVGGFRDVQLADGWSWEWARESFRYAPGPLPPPEPPPD